MRREDAGAQLIKYTAVDDRLHAYLLAHQPPEHEQLKALRACTATLTEARMQITPEQGHFLGLLVRLILGRRVLEIGTFTGYSALAMALTLPADGRLTTCDISEEWTRMARTYWQRAGVADKINLRIAPALATLAQLEREGGLWDLVFIDADKTGYDAYYEAALRLVRPGGLIVLDNMLRRGRVADPRDDEADTAALRYMNIKIAADERVDRVLLPVASGMTLARRR
jgi:predicted O-methyltransferase YrrM